MVERKALALVLVMLGLLAWADETAAQMLETETARLPKAGQVNANAGFEFQTSSEGTESAVPLDFELGILDRLELMVEPVFYTSIQPNHGQSAVGFGDVELTLTGLAIEEQGWIPAVALAAEVKFPTAKNELIGTGEYDYTGYLILSEQFGALDAHFNLGYTIVGQPPGASVGNISDFAGAVTYRLDDRIELYAEVLANTSSGGSEGGGKAGGSGRDVADPGTGDATSTELAGGEVVGTVGAAYTVLPALELSFGVSYDNNNAVLVHPGLTWTTDLF